ncbi:hypothetical protein ACFXEL_11385 [Streptomyces sp. NPDC059382]|uniref:hypothetical protein n=1 Tax=Streptomyces sp. NPDC059382 TaxID=3346816 RepID=UPI0036B05F01
MFRGQGGRAWEHLQGEDRLMRFGLEEDPTAGRLGAGLEVAPAPGGRTGALSFHVLSSSVDSPGAEDAGLAGVPRPRRPHQELDPLHRLVSL